MGKALPKLDDFQSLPDFHWADDTVQVADLRLKAVDHVQLIKLNALISAALAAQSAASKGELFVSYEGKALTNAAFDLFECDDLYGLVDDICREIGEDREGFELGSDGERLTTSIENLNKRSAAWDRAASAALDRDDAGYDEAMAEFRRLA